MSHKIMISLGFLFVLVFATQRIYSQNTVYSIDYTKSVNCIYNEYNAVIKIFFIDTIKKSIIKEFDIKDNNPYYRILGISDSIVKHGNSWVYKVNDVQIGSVISKKNREIYLREVNDSTKVNYAYIREQINKDLPNHIIITNSVDLINKMWHIGCINLITIIDKNGTVVYTHKDSNLNAGYATITENGRYLCYIYGSEDEGGQFLENMYRIIDLDTEGIIVDFPYHTKYGKAISIGSKYNYILIGLNLAMVSHESIIYDFVNNRKYYKYFEWEEYYGKDKDVYQEIDGISFHLKNGDIKKYYFNSDFQVERIK